MTKPRNGNRKCPACGHFLAAHVLGPQGYEACRVPGCAKCAPKSIATYAVDSFLEHAPEGATLTITKGPR